MFNNLIESKAKKQKRTAGSMVSLVVHIALGVVLVAVTANANQQFEAPKEEKVDFVEVKKDEPPPPEPEAAPPPPPPDAIAAPPPPQGFQVLQAPDVIPTDIPDIDLSRKVTDEADFSGKGVAGGIAKGVVGGTGPVPTGDVPYFEFQVEKPAAAAPGSVGPAYPEMLRSAQVEGVVLAQFVVDTSGRADPSTFKVLKTDHELFSNAVKQALPRMRFLPAEVGGRKVKQLVQQPFQFSLSR